MLSAMVSTLVAVFEIHRPASCLLTLAVAVEFFGDRLDAAPMLAAVLTSVCSSAAPIFKARHAAAARSLSPLELRRPWSSGCAMAPSDTCRFEVHPEPRIAFLPVRCAPSRSLHHTTYALTMLEIRHRRLLVLVRDPMLVEAAS